MSKKPSPRKSSATKKAPAQAVKPRRFGRCAWLVTAGILMVITATLLFMRSFLPITVVYQAKDVSVAKPFTITLSQSMRTIALDKIKLTPAVEGSWRIAKGSIITGDKLIFTPAKYFVINTAYRVDLPRAQRSTIGDVTLPSVQFTTEAAPKLQAHGLASIKDKATIPADAALSVSLTSQNHNLRKLSLKTTPAVELVQSVQDDTIYSWKPKTILPHGTEITVELVDEKNNESLLRRVVAVAAEPSIKTPVKERYFTSGDTAQIEFNEPMDPDSQKFISFSVAGEGKWKTDTIYEFTSSGYQPGKVYSYTIKQGLRTKNGGILQADITREYATTGAVAVTNASPTGTGLRQASQTIRFSFDQPVDHLSAEQHFSISSGEVVSRSWQGNTFVVDVRNLGFGQNVTASIAPGVKNTGFGLPSTQTFRTVFVTEIRSTRLAVPFYKQQHRATCAVASLRMALAYRGVNAGEMDIVERMGYNPRNWDESSGRRVWDDPMAMFVGSVDGSITDGSGAGPDAPPVARAARSFGRSADYIMGASVGWIAEQVHAGNPVVMFGSFKNTGFTDWYTPSGKLVRMNLTSHATLVTGVSGEPSNPTGFWVSDPLYGASYWSAATVQANINRDAYAQAVVVR